MENAKILSKHYKSFLNFQSLSKEKKYNDLLNIDGIGETQINSIKNFFSNEINLIILNELGDILNIKDKLNKKKDGLLSNQTFMITGKLNGISRAEVKSMIEENSGITVSSVSKKLNFLIVGEKATNKKIQIAKELKVKIINQNFFLKMLNKTG